MKRECSRLLLPLWLEEAHSSNGSNTYDQHFEKHFESPIILLVGPSHLYCKSEYEDELHE